MFVYVFFSFLIPPDLNSRTINRKREMDRPVILSFILSRFVCFEAKRLWPPLDDSVSCLGEIVINI